MNVSGERPRPLIWEWVWIRGSLLGVAVVVVGLEGPAVSEEVEVDMGLVTETASAVSEMGVIVAIMRSSGWMGMN